MELVKFHELPSHLLPMTSQLHDTILDGLVNHVITRDAAQIPRTVGIIKQTDTP